LKPDKHLESFMPRKKKVAKKKFPIVVDSISISITLSPPTCNRKSWYVYWNGLVSSRSTGHADEKNALVAAERMVREWKAGGDAKRGMLGDTVMSDAEFDSIQRLHFLVKKQDPAAQARAKKTHKAYLEAAAAFRAITGLNPALPR
jgi:hypothetical protein